MATILGEANLSTSFTAFSEDNRVATFDNNRATTTDYRRPVSVYDNDGNLTPPTSDVGKTDLFFSFFRRRLVRRGAAVPRGVVLRRLRGSSMLVSGASPRRDKSVVPQMCFSFGLFWCLARRRWPSSFRRSRCGPQDV